MNIRALAALGMFFSLGNLTTFLQAKPLSLLFVLADDHRNDLLGCEANLTCMTETIQSRANE